METMFELIFWILDILWKPFHLMGRGVGVYWRYQGRLRKEFLLYVLQDIVGGLLLLGVYLTIVWYAWPYIWSMVTTSLLIGLGLITLPFIWVYEGGLSRVAFNIEVWAGWLWSFELFRTIFFASLSTLGAFHLQYLHRLHREMRGLKREQDNLSSQLRVTEQQRSREWGIYRDLCSAVEAVRRRANHFRGRNPSPAAETMRLELERILKTHQFNRFNEQEENTCAAWEEEFADIKKEMEKGRSTRPVH